MVCLSGVALFPFKTVTKEQLVLSGVCIRQNPTFLNELVRIRSEYNDTWWKLFGKTLNNIEKED